MTLDFQKMGRDLDDLGSRDAAARETMAFVLRLRAKGVADIDVLRALEMVPRRAFAPHRYADLALRDMALPIPCGQTMSEPFTLAKILESMDLGRGQRVLEIGTGSGYGTALLARLVGEVVTVERFRSLSLEAQLRLRRLEAKNVAVYWGDGLALPTTIGLFDRILVDGAVEEAGVSALLEFLAEDGVFLGSASAQAEGPVDLVRISHERGAFVRTRLGPSRAAALIAGISQAL